MEVFVSIIEVITNNLFNQVAVLIGLIAIVGLALQRKPFEEVVAGGIRATIGVMVLNLGVEIFAGGLTSFQAIVSSAMGLEPPTAESTLAEFNTGAGSVIPLIIAGGFIVHLALVRVFPAARYVYLTGHLMYWMSVVIAASLVEMFGDVNRWILAGAGSLIAGSYWVLQPIAIGPLMRRVMGDDQVGLAHTDSTIALAAGYGARALRLGDPVAHNSENLKLPRMLSFFKDINVSTAFVTGSILLIAILFAATDVVEEQMAGATLLPWVWALLQGLRFAAGIAILLFGVRMFLAEIVPAFQGLSNRVLPGSKPALDLPVTFTKAPTAVMIGFLTSVAVFLVLMAVFAGLGWFVLVPPMIMLFFGGGAGGVFGNAAAGWRGAVFGGVINGVVLAFGQWIGWGLWSGTAPELATLADADWFVVGWALLGLGALLAPLGVWGAMIISVSVLLVTILTLALLSSRQKRAERQMAREEGGADETKNETSNRPEPATRGSRLAEELVPAGPAAPSSMRTEAAASSMALRPPVLQVLAVCGAGMGTSLMLSTTAKKALDRLGVEANVTYTDLGSARSQTPDVVIAQQTYLEEIASIAPVAVQIDHFVNVEHIKERLSVGLQEKGWL
ncbi:PTS ascorbate transporter subunit IIC [Pseudoclavibacter sp. RFBJ3]|uniref:PTS transporter subunit IIC n=1 Tax=Pseudoclavibacter sp. RFBH5 TaxID=2080576 RepID=UPI000CE7B370|nr:PTS transporter subunit IIC [Pseudoclavibacter sp. RFBH5]PPF87534.1 PTS ascorbate transporter subunit IIC [Pseudoclavibacter sp. RFBJ5]PPF90384.1 PTS ascorbate transporter subunit IIC [Pseudoclavibacter sp. RFBJ3]PPG01069.1 PTS ascorbate transporter subunit IIC [Pseudoclavibacter sp. RFBH5]PPG26172.1 PTS ascorbate transporter subunit IIC [Pseudoclavibacter sp. RFBI4]